MSAPLTIRRSVKDHPARVPSPAAPPAPTFTRSSAAPVQRFLSRPTRVQGQVAQPVLRALALQRQEETRLSGAREVVQQQVAALGHVPPVQRLIQPPVPDKPVTPTDWVTVMRARAQGVEGQRLDARTFGEFQALQRQVAQSLSHGFRADRGKAAARYATYGEHLATLQRHALSAPVSRVVLGLVPPAERLPLQRATDEALQRQMAQEQAALNFDTHTALQRQLAELDAEATQPVLQRIQARRGAGSPLPEAIQRHLEQGLNHDLSRVRIHDDAEADKLAKGVNALAFTTGTDIFFQAGRFNPNTQTGLELLAHEVTHTVQQSQGRVGKGIDPDASLETEARAMGARLAQVMPSPKSLFPTSPHAPGVYSQGAALRRAQTGAVQRVALKPLYDLHPQAVQRWGNPFSWAADKVKDGVSAIADKGKELIAGALTALPGYRELCMAFGKDLVTGQAMRVNPDSILDALSGWVPGPLKDILKALKETQAIPKAWTWFKGELGKLDLGGALGEVASAIGKADLGAAKTAVTQRISGLRSLITGSARKIADIGLTALAAGLGPVGQQVVAQLRQGGDLILQVLKNPAGFARNLLGALKGGFSRFAGNAPKHLQNGLGQWLTGASGVTFPARLDLQGVFLTALSVMGLTYQALRGRLVRAMGPNGERQVSAAEGTLDTLKTIRTGLHKADELKTNQAPISTEVVSGLKTEVTKSVVTAGITKVASMLIPGGGFVQALLGAFRSVQFVVQQGQQIMGVVTSAIQSVSAIAAGNLGAAISGVETTLARSIPVALGFLTKVLGLGSIGTKIKAVIGKVRGKLDALLDRAVARIKGLISKLSRKNTPGQKPGTGEDSSRSVAVKARVRTHLAATLRGPATPAVIRNALEHTMNQFRPQGLNALRTRKAGQGRYGIEASASPYENVGLTDTNIMFDADDLELMTLRRGVALRASINGIEVQTANTPGKKGELPKHAEENFVINAQRILQRFAGQTPEVIVQLSSSPCGDPGCDADLQKKLHNCASTLIEFAQRHQVKLRVQVLGIYSPKVKGGKALSRDGLRRMLDHGIRVETWSPDQALAQLEASAGPLEPGVRQSISSKLRNIIKELEALSGLNLR
ncbi:eCIS core domain-containing protein [Deinococcus radiotolerans]|uniref:DUF4157 domain-containing protein n=1 Tax=Deinococcus radiotolerans TaxID=1309407 RepID=A0ABQ2FG01_9DEIO|nr:DUF4157 domain-containing protein [Deinococcus radiotolerans]GGK94704.1 hypothetical protein GCM10010844_11530 [Deinococcus radiotolerans]